jgi:hypothetical protein
MPAPRQSRKPLSAAETRSLHIVTMHSKADQLAFMLRCPEIAGSPLTRRSLLPRPAAVAAWLLRRPVAAAAAGSTRQVQDGVGVRVSLGQRADRLCCGQDDQFDLAAAGLIPELRHDRQGAIRAGTDH